MIAACYEIYTLYADFYLIRRLWTCQLYLPETGSCPDEWSAASKTLQGRKGKEFANVFFLYILHCNMILLLHSS